MQEKHYPKLTLNQIKVAKRLCMANAGALKSEAELLLRYKKYARASFLAIMAFEELGKVGLLQVFMLKNWKDSKIRKKFWTSFRRGGQSHRDKLFMGLNQTGRLDTSVQKMKDSIDLTQYFLKTREQSMYVDHDVSTNKLISPIKGGWFGMRQTKRLIGLLDSALALVASRKTIPPSSISERDRNILKKFMELSDKDPKFTAFIAQPSAFSTIPLMATQSDWMRYVMDLYTGQTTREWTVLLYIKFYRSNVADAFLNVLKNKRSLIRGYKVADDQVCLYSSFPVNQTNDILFKAERFIKHIVVAIGVASNKIFKFHWKVCQGKPGHRMSAMTKELRLGNKFPYHINRMKIKEADLGAGDLSRFALALGAIPKTQDIVTNTYYRAYKDLSNFLHISKKITLNNLAKEYTAAMDSVVLAQLNQQPQDLVDYEKNLLIKTGLGTKATINHFVKYRRKANEIILGRTGATFNDVLFLKIFSEVILGSVIYIPSSN